MSNALISAVVITHDPARSSQEWQRLRCSNDDEKAADSLRDVLRHIRPEKNFLICAWPGGTNAVDKVDFTPVSGWEGYFWEDADQPGRKAMVEAARLALEAGLTKALRVQPPEGVEKGWDAADAVGEDWSAKRILEFIETTAKPFPAQSMIEQQSNEELAAEIGAELDVYDNVNPSQDESERRNPADGTAARERFVPIYSEVHLRKLERVEDPTNDPRINELLQPDNDDVAILHKEQYLRVHGLLKPEIISLDDLVLPNYAELSRGGMHLLGLTDRGLPKILRIELEDTGYGSVTEHAVWLSLGRQKRFGAALRWGMDNAPVRVICPDPREGQLLANAFRSELIAGQLTIAGVPSPKEIDDVRWPDPAAAHRIIVVASASAHLTVRDIRTLADHYGALDCGVALVETELYRTADRHRDGDAVASIRNIRLPQDITLERLLMTDEWDLDHEAWVASYGRAITAKTLFSRRTVERLRRMVEAGQTTAYKELLKAPGIGLCSTLNVKFKAIDRAVKSGLPKQPEIDLERLFDTEVFEGAHQFYRTRVGDRLKFVRAIQPGPDQDDDEPTIKPICDAFDVIAESMDDHGMNSGAVIRWVTRDGRPHVFTIPRTTLTDPRKALDALLDHGWRCDIKRFQDAAQIVMSMESDRFMRTKDQGGWQTVIDQDGKQADVFIIGRETIYPKSVDRTAERFEGAVFHARKIPSGFKTRGTSKEWLDNLGRLMRGNPVLQISAALSLASPLLKLLNYQGGGLHFYGRSSDGKSISQLFGASLVGGGGGGDLQGYICSWNITDSGIEGQFHIRNDMAMFLDEFGLCNGYHVDIITYTIAGQGRQRAARDGESRDVKFWTNITLSSGEMTLSQKMAEVNKQPKAGQLVRFAEIPVSVLGYEHGNGVIRDYKSHGFKSSKDMVEYIRSVTHSYYGQVFRDWMQILVDDKEVILKRVNAFIAQFKNQWFKPGDDNQVGRVGDRFAVIAAAGAVAAEEGLFPGSPADFLDGVGSLYQVWTDARGDRSQKFETLLLKNQIRQKLIELQPRFARISGTNTVREAYAPQMGFERENKGRVELLVHASNKSQLQEIIRSPDLDSALKQLADDGWIVRGSDRMAMNAKTPHHKGGAGGRYIVFDLTRITGDDVGQSDHPSALPTDHFDAGADATTEQDQLNQILGELLRRQIKVSYMMGGEPRQTTMMAKRVLEIAIDPTIGMRAGAFASIREEEARDALESEGIRLTGDVVGILLRSAALISITDRLRLKGVALDEVFTAGGYRVKKGIALKRADHFLAWLDGEEGRPPRKMIEPWVYDEDDGALAAFDGGRPHLDTLPVLATMATNWLRSER